MHGKFPAIQQTRQNSILFHETIPLKLLFFLLTRIPNIPGSELSSRDVEPENTALCHMLRKNFIFFSFTENRENEIKKIRNKK
jgi:hypothetical protein